MIGDDGIKKKIKNNCLLYGVIETIKRFESLGFVLYSAIRFNVVPCRHNGSVCLAEDEKNERIMSVEETRIKVQLYVL